MRVGAEPRGIVASGYVVGKPFEDENWNPDEDSRLQSAWYANIEWDVLLPRDAPPFPRTKLQQGGFAKMYWSARRSGVVIPPRIATTLEQHWVGFLQDREILAKQVASQEACVGNSVPKKELPKRIRQEVSRIVRDTAITREIKALYDHRCQLCGKRLELSAGKHYAEAHHLRPLGGSHKGRDIRANLICVCPNCHARLDFRAVRITPSTLKVRKHEVDQRFIDYHNKHCGKG